MTRDAAGLVDVDGHEASAGFEIGDASGVRAQIASKSSMESGTSASRAMARRWSTALVEPAVAATPAMAFSNAARVQMSRGVQVVADRVHDDLAAADTRLRLCACRTCGTAAVPMGERPINSMTVAMVLAVN